MHTMAMSGMVAALLVSGCALESSESEPTTGEAQEAVTSFSKTFSFHKHYAGKSTFVVPAHGMVTVVAHATWNRPSACRLPTFDIEFVKAGLFGSEGAQTYTTNGSTATHSWTDLGAGAYHLVFDSINDEIECELAGAVTVTIKP
jgi:hypothetical protein